MLFDSTTPEVATHKFRVRHPQENGAPVLDEFQFKGHFWKVKSECTQTRAFIVTITVENNKQLIFSKFLTKSPHTPDITDYNVFHPKYPSFEKTVVLEAFFGIPETMEVEMTIARMSMSPLLTEQEKYDKCVEFALKDEKNTSYWIDKSLLNRRNPHMLQARMMFDDKKIELAGLNNADFKLFALDCYGPDEQSFTAEEYRRLLQVYTRFTPPDRSYAYSPTLDNFYKKDFLAITQFRNQLVYDSVPEIVNIVNSTDREDPFLGELHKTDIPSTFRWMAKEFCWLFYIYRTTWFQTEYLSIGAFLFPNARANKNWKTSARFKLELTLPGKDGPFVRSVILSRDNLTQHEPSIGCPTFMKWSDIEALGIPDDAPIFVSIEVLPDDQQLPPEYDGCANFTMTIENDDTTRSIQVNKDLLAHHCEYFRAQFFGGFAESTSTEGVMKDVNYDDIKTMLDLIYHRSKLITRATIGPLLTTADRFMCQFLLDWIDYGLLDRYYGDGIEMSHADKIELANNYALHALRDQINLKCNFGASSHGAIKPERKFPH